MRLSDLLAGLEKPSILLEKLNKKKFKIQTLEDFLKDEGVKLAEAKLGNDIPMKDYDEDELKGNLGRSEAKKKFPGDKFTQPRIHGSTARPIMIVDENGRQFDLNRLRTLITTRPTKMLKQNTKMKNSIGEDVVFYNLGLPAIKGLLFDESDKKFKVVSTCPMAGACQQYCYAHKGGYVQFKGSTELATKMLNFLINDPEGFKAKLSAELATAVKSATRSGTKVILRWHDSGDFFSPSYKDLAFEVAEKFPTVKFYAYTKDASIASGNAPENFIFNFSQGAKPSEEDKVNFDTTKNARVLQKEEFKEFIITDEKGHMVKDKYDRMQYKSEEALQTLKERLAKKFGRPVEKVILYRDLMKMPEKADTPKGEGWTVIVATGDGDDAATRRDVLDTILMIH